MSEKCGCRLMTIEECLLERGHFSPKDQDYGIKYCPTHAVAHESMAVVQSLLKIGRRAGKRDNGRAGDDGRRMELAHAVSVKFKKLKKECQT